MEPSTAIAGLWNGTKDDKVYSVSVGIDKIPHEGDRMIRAASEIPRMVGPIILTSTTPDLLVSQDGTADSAPGNVRSSNCALRREQGELLRNLRAIFLAWRRLLLLRLLVIFSTDFIFFDSYFLSSSSSPSTIGNIRRDLTLWLITFDERQFASKRLYRGLSSVTGLCDLFTKPALLFPVECLHGTTFAEFGIIGL